MNVRLEFQHFPAHRAIHHWNFRGFIMSYAVQREPAGTLPFRELTVWQRLSYGIFRRRRASVARLDIAALSDHLKRDLGFLDGRC
ncbi:hypothetical protein [Shinella oryzae]|uniref:Uncharacterized protein n=1 Tax=Shinella oryzae TaxID=2871820 RepID=A0ABY9K306_9HYPH|nr:hypothetical protein [Shinella oryzae]WLS02967.1 hypothetical protein Q9315_16375 [Shinella oryzae]